MRVSPFFFEQPFGHGVEGAGGGTGALRRQDDRVLHPVRLQLLEGELSDGQVVQVPLLCSSARMVKVSLGELKTG